MKVAFSIAYLQLLLRITYVAAFGFASQSYENRLDSIEQKTNIMVSQLAYNKNEAIKNLAYIQLEECPSKPMFNNPISIIKSIFGKNTYCDPIIKDISHIIWSQKIKDSSIAPIFTKDHFITDVDFDEVEILLGFIENTTFLASKFKSVDFKKSEFDNNFFDQILFDDFSFVHSTFEKNRILFATFNKSAIAYSNFHGDKFDHVAFYDSSFNYSSFRNVHFKEVRFIDTRFFNDVSFVGVKFERVHGLTYDLLKNTISLYNTTGIDKEVEKKLRQTHPHLFLKSSEQRAIQLEEQNLIKKENPKNTLL